MAIISIVYFSQSGTTDLVADAIARGAVSLGGTEVHLFRIRGNQIKEGRWQDDDVLQSLSASDAIIFGAPTYMGGPAAQFKAFADATAGIWHRREWKDKVAGGFTVSNSPSGDKLSTLMYFTVLAAQHGMTWINSDILPRQPDGTNRLGASIGVMAQNPGGRDAPPALDPGDALTARKYGLRVARFAQRLHFGTQRLHIARGSVGRS